MSPWFECPGIVNGKSCDRRVIFLYGPSKWFLCRHYYGLFYESQREDKTQRALRRTQNISQHLGGSANMTKLFPEKPKGIHDNTYMRLFWEHHEAEMEQLAGMREWLAMLESKLG
jgi:hypothetical protein